MSDAETEENFFATAIGGLQRALRIKTYQQSAPRASRLDMAALQEAVLRGSRAREMLQSSAWKEHVAPFLEAELKRCQMPPWKPGDNPDPAAIDAVHKFNSGAQRAYQRVPEEIARWVAAGDEAMATLKAEQDRQAAAKKAAE